MSENEVADGEEQGLDRGVHPGAGDGDGGWDAAGLVAAGGKRAYRGLIKYVAGFAGTVIFGAVGVWLWPGGAPEAVVGVPTTAPAAGQIQPAPADINRPAVQVVEVYAQETEADRRIMQILDQLTAAVGHLASEVHESSGVQAPPVGQAPDVGTAAAEGPLDIVPEIRQRPVLSIWEDGNCWTPADMPVMQLCGAAEGDGYVIRWMSVAGDSRGPEIPDADWLAVRGKRDHLVWSGHHPATGELVTVNYWAAGHVLAMHAAGRLLFRIDRLHRVSR